MSTAATVRASFPLTFPWRTADPFLFCAHHRDAYPAGTADQGPDPSSLRGRAMGSDFSGKDGWSMYHGQKVPGFPSHPHCGFETVTIGREGFIDHADSLGACARFGEGDVQWITTGGGVVHSEMFPLVRTEAGNPTELFQIWLNLPAASKRVPAHFRMFWKESVPRVRVSGPHGDSVVSVIAGAWDSVDALEPPPHSWATDPANDVAIWSLRVVHGAPVVLPAARAGTRRVLYAFAGGAVRVQGEVFATQTGLDLDPEATVEVAAEEEYAELLVLQGRPIGEPVAQHGPFVMNHVGEIREMMMEYQATGFGGWPWERPDPVHPREEGRFARHGDGSMDRPQEG